MEEYIHSKEFYELCQVYRHAYINKQPQVVTAFEAVKEAILKKHNEIIKP
jgi:hypothetical protein